MRFRHIKDMIKGIVYGGKDPTEDLIAELRKGGAQIGQDVHLFGGLTFTRIDSMAPYLLTIGDHVNMVSVRILTHDYAWSVLKRMGGAVIGNNKPVVIGSNVFVGSDTIIMAGSKIGDNVIIGARSVVTGVVDSDSVYAGCPARKIMTIQEYKDRRERAQLDEAREIFDRYYAAFGDVPKEKVFREYFFLFSNDPDHLNPEFDKQMRLCGNYEESREAMRSQAPPFASYQAFVEDCLARAKEEPSVEKSAEEDRG